MIEVFTFVRFAHFQLQEFTRISMKTWSLIESCAEFSAISGFIFFIIIISSSLLFYFRADSPRFPVFLLTELSMQCLFRKHVLNSGNYKPNSYFSFLFSFYLIIFFSLWLASTMFTYTLQISKNELRQLWWLKSIVLDCRRKVKTLKVILRTS